MTDEDDSPEFALARMFLGAMFGAFLGFVAGSVVGLSYIAWFVPGPLGGRDQATLDAAIIVMACQFVGCCLGVMAGSMTGLGIGVKGVNKIGRDLATLHCKANSALTWLFFNKSRASHSRHQRPEKRPSEAMPSEAVIADDNRDRLYSPTTNHPPSDGIQS